MTDEAGAGGGAGGDVAVASHPVTDFAARLCARLEALTTSPVPVWSMSSEEKQQALRALATAHAQLDGLRWELLAETDRDPAALGAGDRSAADWVARETRQPRAAARADLRIAQALEEQYPLVRAGVAAGRVRADQARAIVRGLDLLPRRGEFAVDADQRTRAEAHLVELAADQDAKALEQLARRIYCVICPEHADAYEGRLLEAEEARAARKVSFEMWQDPQGVAHGKFRIPRLHAEMLKKALEAIMSPARSAACASDGEGESELETTGESTSRDMRPMPVRRGEALCELLERLRADDLPQAGGGDATVVVTMSLEDLTARLEAAGVATLDTGARISAAEARRLACRQRLVPAVLSGKSVVLDQGRATRLHTKGQRRALMTQQQHCTAEHCETPAAMCQVHHDLAWQHGGHTDTTSGRLLCGPHHRRVHDPAYRHERLPDGTLRFHRRE